MGNLIYIVVTVLINSWVIGFLGYDAGSIIHVLLVIAAVVILSSVYKWSVPFKNAAANQD